MTPARRPTIVLGLALALASTAPQDRSEVRSAPNQRRGQLAVRTSPLGSTTVRLAPVRGDVHELVFDLEVTAAGGARHLIPGVRGNGFHVSDVGRLVVIDACESGAVPTRVEVRDLGGRVLLRREARGLTCPSMSPRGDAFLFRTPAATWMLDLETLAQERHPFFDQHAFRSDGRLVGVRCEPGHRVRLHADGREHVLQLDGPLRELVALAGTHVLLVTACGALAVDAGSGEPAGWSPSSLAPAPGPPGVGEPVDPQPLTQPWPLGANVQRAIGNTYAEYQNYGGSPYLHPGIDVMGADGEPVYATRAGFVKAILTTSGAFHWRVAIADSDDATTTDGYLYAHLDLPTIVVSVGDFVTRGQYLGDLVPWPVAGFTHVHFARIQDQGVQWGGSWLCTRNPLLQLRGRTESSPPFFENALGADLFAFCLNETSTYVDPQSLTGSIDIVVKVGDLIESSWVCSVQELFYSIFPAGAPDVPLVHDKLAVRFDMPLDTYQGGPFDPFVLGMLYKEDATCDTNGDYDFRDFYHVITNSDGDEDHEPSDYQEAWDTTLVPNGDYVVEVTALDAAGNATTASMGVRVLN